MAACAIILPAAGSPSLTHQCLVALLAAPPGNIATEIIAVDDGASALVTRVLAAFRDRIRVIKCEPLGGMAAAYNAAAGAASGEYLAFVRSDLLPRAGWLEALMRHALLHPSAAITGSKIAWLDGTVLHAGIAIGQDRRPRYLYAGFPDDHAAVSRSRPITLISCAGALVRRAAFRDVGGFDERFGDDYAAIDLCLRLAERGLTIWYCAESLLWSVAPRLPILAGSALADDAAYDRLWRHRVRPDDLDYYLADGLLEVGYGAGATVTFRASPLLGGVDDGERDQQADRLLAQRSRQVFALIEEQAALTDRLQEATFRRAILDGKIEALEPVGRAQLQTLIASRARLRLHPEPAPRISVLLVVRRSPEQAYHSLMGLLTAAGGPTWELVVVDTTGSDAVAALVRRLDHVAAVSAEASVTPLEVLLERARGEWLCWLSDDVVPGPGWLSQLAATLDRCRDAGAVAGALARADGRLHAAGGILWRDGAVVGYGAGEDPLAPEYRYLREVDCSAGAGLLMRRDALTSDAHADLHWPISLDVETELCLGVQHAGHAVVYQPLALAARVGAGEPPSVWLTSDCTARWSHRLRCQPAAGDSSPLQARDRRRGRRILLIDDRVPAGALGQGFPRTRALLEMLANLGYIVSFLPCADPTAAEPATTELQQRGIEVLHGAADIEGRLAERAGLYDVAIISRPHNAKLIGLVKAASPTTAVIYDAEAVFALRDAYQAEVAGRPLTPAAIEARLAAELAPVADADAAMAVSAVERDVIRAHRPGAPVVVWGCPALVRRPVSAAVERHDVLFVGYLGAAPNADAVGYFIKECWPLVRERVEARLHIVGAQASPELRAAAEHTPNVTLLGPVPELSVLYDRARVFVAPHRFAAGIPLKVVDAMANGVPCVITPLLARQLGVSDGAEVLVGADAPQLADQIVRLWRDDELWHRLQQHAWRFIEQQYAPSQLQSVLKASIEAACASHLAR